VLKIICCWGTKFVEVIQLLFFVCAVMVALFFGLPWIASPPFVMLERHREAETLRLHEHRMAEVKETFPNSIVGTVFRWQAGRISLAGDPITGILLEDKAPPLCPGDIVALDPVVHDEEHQGNVFRVTYVFPN
jgi:hypothetical protein